MPQLDETFHRRRRLLLLGGFALLAVVLALRGWLAWVGSFPGDRLLATTHFEPLANPLQQLVTFYGLLGTPGVAVPTVVIAAWAVRRLDGPRAAFRVLLASGVVIAVVILKNLWGPTPLWAAISPHGGVDYPSGHTAYAASVFGCIAVIGRQRAQAEIVVIAACLILGMGAALIVSRTHLLSDVLGGYTLGMSWLILVVAWTARREASVD